MRETFIAFIGSFIETYLRLDEEDTDEYNEIMEAIPLAEQREVTEVLTYWEQRGLDRGREEGQIYGMREIVAALIENRFGPMSAQDLTAFEGLSLAALKALGLAVPGAASYAELQQRFFAPRAADE